jgi:hypothetical protein
VAGAYTRAVIRGGRHVHDRGSPRQRCDLRPLWPQWQGGLTSARVRAAAGLPPDEPVGSKSQEVAVSLSVLYMSTSLDGYIAGPERRTGQPRRRRLRPAVRMLDIVRFIDTPEATHIRYRIRR